MSALPSAPQPSVNLVSIGEFVAELRKFPESAFTDIPRLREFQRRFVVRPDTLEPYLLWDAQHYTRNLIDKTPLYELLAICWDIGQASSIHNHAGQNCWMAAPIGRLLVQNYRTAVHPNYPVHKVHNPRAFGERAVSIHIYSRPFDSCIAYSEDHQTCGAIKLVNTSEFGVCQDPRLQRPRRVL